MRNRSLPIDFYTQAKSGKSTSNLICCSIRDVVAVAVVLLRASQRTEHGLCLVFLSVLGEWNIFQTLEILDTIGAINIVTGSRNAPHGKGPKCGIVVVKTLGFKVGLDSVCRLESIVPGHLVEQVVDDMCGTNAVVEKVKNSVGTINGRQGALDPGPFAFSVVRNRRISVLQPCVQDQPSVDKEVGTPVPANDRHSTVFVHEVSQPRQTGHHCGSRNHNLGIHLAGEHSRIGTEMIGNIVFQGLSIISNPARAGQAQQIQRPAQKQVRPNLKGGKGTVSHGFVPRSIKGLTFQIFGKTIVFPGGRDV
mmetsp:Transcript_15260/g.36314  ORF Transcript_15260/g.36314 Transcript_15260/m.36314 type:complete len:307 (+) Transcript_15260:318-1238(+)